jgi:hypothetical protein
MSSLSRKNPRALHPQTSWLPHRQPTTHYALTILVYRVPVATQQSFAEPKLTLNFSVLVSGSFSTCKDRGRLDTCPMASLRVRHTEPKGKT